MSHWSALGEESSIPWAYKTPTQATAEDTARIAMNSCNKGSPFPRVATCKTIVPGSVEVEIPKVGDGGMGQTWNCGMTC